MRGTPVHGYLSSEEIAVQLDGASAAPMAIALEEIIG